MLGARSHFTVGASVLVASLGLAACSSGAVSSGDGTDAADGGNVTLNLATVNNPQMKDMEQLKTEYESANPGTTVNFQVMEEGDLRAAVTADVASGAGQYDIVTIGAYETPQWGANGWLVDLTETLTPEFPTIVLPPEMGQAWPFRIEEISRYDERGPAWRSFPEPAPVASA